jgi:hypothetical protein
MGGPRRQIILLKPPLAGLQWRGSRLRLPEASQTPPGAASSAPPSSNRNEVFSAESEHYLRPANEVVAGFGQWGRS